MLLVSPEELASIWPGRNVQFREIRVGQLIDEGVARRMIRAIKEQIHAGAYQPGDKLPSTRSFATEWGASRTTVTSAFGQLIAEGYIVTRPGARAVVAEGLGATKIAAGAARAEPPRLSTFARRLLALAAPTPTQAHRIADFRYGDLSASDFPVLAWRRALNATTLRRAARLRYDDPQGSIALRTAAQGYLWRARGIRCTPEDIVIVNGSQQGLDLCARLLLDPGDAFVIENPGYVLARNVFLAVGGVASPTPVDREGLRTEDLPTARLAYVTPSHQYPLGSVLSATRRRALVEWATRNDAQVVEDDYDGEYRHDLSPIPPVHTIAPDRVIYVGTFSKTLSPTLRLGYLVVPPALRRPFAEAKRLTDRHTPLPEQDALANFLNSGAYERHVRSIRKRNAERRTVLLKALKNELGSTVTIVGAETGLHVVAWLKGVAAEREPDLIEAAHAAGIGLYPISPLYEPSGPRPTEVGLVLGYSGLETDVIRRGARALATIVAEHR
ncbi:MocR-like pyridoxine biosynthesis transcription factor PdxR [Alsobacter sp. SYSU BS001988]